MTAAEKRPDVVIDVSNACRDRGLGGGSAKATLGRLTSLLTAWNNQFGFEPEWVGVADANLRFLLDRDDRSRFSSWVREARIEESHEDADERVLELAGDLGTAVLSNDAYKGHRRRHPWVQGNTRDFIGWEVGVEGPRLRVRDMGIRSDSTISAAQEADLIKERRLRGHPSVLGSAYRCDTQRCLYHQYSPERLPTLPAIGPDGAVVCPGCGRDLVPLGERPAAAELKLSTVGGDEEHRWLLEEGRAVVLGRGKDADGDLSRILDRKSHALISRKHLELAVVDGQLLATDLGSTNGTSVLRSEHSQRDGVVEVRLPPHERVEVGVRDELVIAGVVSVARSGQRFPPGRPSVPPRFRGTSAAGATRVQ